MNRDSGLWLVVFWALFSLLVVLAVPVSAYITPSVPQLTISFEAHPYYVPPEYGTDPYTGANITIRAGYTVKNESMVFTIKTQQFTPYTDAEGNAISLTCVIRGKGHFEPDWKEFGHYEATPGSEYIVQSFGYEGNNIPNIGYVPNGGKVDYQVEAQVGFYTFHHDGCYTSFNGTSSGPSPTLTLTIGQSPTPTPTPSPIWPTPYQTATPSPFQSATPSPGGETQPGIGQVELVFVGIIAFILGAGLGLLIYLVKRK